MAKSIPEMSLDTRTLVAMLRAVPVGDVLTYAAMSEATGRDIANRHRYLLQSAINVCLRAGAVFAAVSGVGMKRLKDEDIVSVGVATITHVRRAAKRGVIKLGAVQNFAAMPAERQIEHNAAMSILGVIAHVGATAQVKAASAAVREIGNNAVPPAKMLAHFSKA